MILQVKGPEGTIAHPYQAPEGGGYGDRYDVLVAEDLPEHGIVFRKVTLEPQSDSRLKSVADCDIVNIIFHGTHWTHQFPRAVSRHRARMRGEGFESSKVSTV